MRGNGGVAEKMRKKEEEVTFFEQILYSRQLSNRLLLILSHLILIEVLSGRYYHFPFTDKETDVANFILIEIAQIEPEFNSRSI